MSGRREPAWRRWRRDERGEALPAAILFVGVMFTILIGIHVVIVSVARAAAQTVAESALAAAQAAGTDPLTQDCDENPATLETVRQCEGILAGRISIAGAHSSIIETRPPVIAVEDERGSVTAVVFAATISPVLGTVELKGEACGPLDDVPVSDLTGTDIWEC